MSRRPVAHNGRRASFRRALDELQELLWTDADIARSDRCAKN